jgi:hypothetical protein
VSATNGTISTSEVGLASYIRIKGGKLIGYNSDRGEFEFESDRAIQDWRIEYGNSDCYRHDTEVMYLRQFKSRK